MKKLILLVLITFLWGANVMATNCKDCNNEPWCLENCISKSPDGTQYDAQTSNSTIADKTAAASKQTFSLCKLGICYPIKTPEDLASKIIKLMATLIGSLSLLAFMLGGFMLMVQIDDDGRAKGKSIMKNSIIAIIVTLSAYVIVTFVYQVILGLSD